LSPDANVRCWRNAARYVTQSETFDRGTAGAAASSHARGCVQDKRDHVDDGRPGSHLAVFRSRRGTQEGMKSEWEAFTAGLEQPSAASNDWITMSSVRHGTHLTHALRIAEDRKLSAELIYEGRLMTTRTKVIYFSPNTWHDGSRYGTFEFEVDWSDLLQGRHLMWVEPVYSYAIPIHRFMLTRASAVAGLTSYDPAIDQGPLRLVDGTWLRTRRHAAEIVVDEDVAMSAITSFQLAKHHDFACSLSESACSEAGYTGMQRTSGRLAAALMGRGLKSLNSLLTRDGRLTTEAEHGYSGLYFALVGNGSFGGLIADDGAAADLIRAACLLVHAGDREGARRLVQMLDSKERLDRVMLNLARETFDAPTWSGD
jgi:hypothetical protein